MTNDQYIAALNKALANMNKQARQNILLEIKSHALESGGKLSDRFGSPETLAQQYLDGEILAPTLSEKATGVGKRLLKWIGIGVVALVAVAAVAGSVVWYMAADDFNYADEKAPELNQADANWIALDQPVPAVIRVDQSKVAFYWHEQNTLRWQCKGDGAPQLSDNQLQIRHASCLVFLPRQAITLQIDQAQVVIVRPQAALNLAIEQGSVQIAENGEKYRYIINTERSKLDNFSSHEDADKTITIKAHESQIERYPTK